MTEQTVDPQWSDEEIDDEINTDFRALDMDWCESVRGLAMRIRDDLQSTIDALRAQLATQAATIDVLTLRIDDLMEYYIGVVELQAAGKARVQAELEQARRDWLVSDAKLTGDLEQARNEIAALKAQVQELEETRKDLIELNKRNVDDAARIISGNQNGLELAYVSLVEWGKREQRIKELEAENTALKAQGEWEPVPDGEYQLPTGHVLNVCFRGEELEQWHLANLYKDGSPKDVEEITLGEYRLFHRKPQEGAQL